jgi:hypothetical protein
MVVYLLDFQNCLKKTKLKFFKVKPGGSLIGSEIYRYSIYTKMYETFQKNAEM